MSDEGTSEHIDSLAESASRDASPRPEFDTFVLEGPDALLTPSTTLAALASGLGIGAEDVGAVAPLSPGRFTIELERRAARRISTPRDVPARLSGRGRALLLLTRESDERDEAHGLERHIGVSAGELPGPSALTAALGEALGLSGEDLGVVLEGHDFARATMPSFLARRLKTPLELAVGQTSLRIEVASKKR